MNVYLASTCILGADTCWPPQFPRQAQDILSEIHKTVYHLGPTVCKDIFLYTDIHVPYRRDRVWKFSLQWTCKSNHAKGKHVYMCLADIIADSCLKNMWAPRGEAKRRTATMSIKMYIDIAKSGPRVGCQDGLHVISGELSQVYSTGENIRGAGGVKRHKVA